MAEDLVRTVDADVVDLPPETRKPLDLERAQILSGAPKAVASPEDYTAADQWRGQWAAFRKRAWEPWEKWTQVLHKRHQLACQLRGVFFNEGDAKDKQVHAAMDAFRRKEEAERRRKELEETERQMREDEERRKREAKVLKKAGHVEQAKAVLEAPPVPTAPVNLPSRVPAATFTRYRKVWKWRPVFSTEADGARARLDVEARKKAAKLVPREYLDLDDKALTELAKRSAGTIKVPGIVFYEDVER